MTKAASLIAVLLCMVLVSVAQTPQEPHIFFRKQIELSDDQIARIDRGQAVAKVLRSSTPAEIFVFGAVYVKAAPEEYIKLALDLSRLGKLPSYLGVRRISTPPNLSDLDGVALEPDDIRKLKYCRPGKCDVQLPAEAMNKIQQSVNWSRPDVAAQVNDRIRKMAFELLQQYQQGGNKALGIYRDKSRSFDVAIQFEELLERSETFLIYLPELNRYLLDFPAPTATMNGLKSMFYWERIDFGLKPTLRLNHAIAYSSAGPRGLTHVIAAKQLYASHYFQIALDLSVCVKEPGRTNREGFYLISLKASRQDGLTGLKGSILRRAIVSKTRTAQENALAGIKKALEMQR
jgi:hypothetical protein